MDTCINNTEYTSSMDYIETPNQTIHQFITTLYGPRIDPNFIVLWKKPDYESISFRFIDLFSSAAEFHKDDHDVYFEIGLQKIDPPSNKRGKQEAVVCIPGLWMDIDIQGPGHKQTNLPKSQEKAFELLDGFGLYPSIIVNSGGGLHAYWLFNQPWYFEDKSDHSMAMELSKRFQKTFIRYGQQFGYQLDYSGDLNRLLRVPGTYNHKGQCVPVEIIRIDESCRYEPPEIDSYLNKWADDYPDIIYEGKRNTTLTQIGGVLRGIGNDFTKINSELQSINLIRCFPPLDAKEVERIAYSIANYPPNNDQGKNQQKPTQTQRILNIAEILDLFHTADNEPYAKLDVNGHKEVWPLKSKAVRYQINRQYHIQNDGRYPSPKAREEALDILSGKCLYDSPERNVHIRVAEANGCIFFDLCNNDWEVIEISQNGWKIIQNPPVAFKRSKGMLEIPKPEYGGRIEDLYTFLNADDSAKCLIVAFIIACFRPDRPFPILLLQGEQGSAKSTTARIVRELIDPSASPLRTFPKNEQDLMISANNSWVLAYDNLSGIRTGMSDALCRISTGGGYSSRELWTNDDEKIFNSKRPVILNGIDDLASRGDLADRSILVNLPRIPSKKRRLEDDVWKEFNLMKPKIIGALLDAVSCSLKNIDQVVLKSFPRMADFTKWVVAAEPKLPWPQGYFMEMYKANHQEASTGILESDPVASVLHEFMSDKDEWTGMASALLKGLNRILEDDSIRKSKSWPKNPSYLSGRVKRIAPNLREIGYEVEQVKVKGKKLWKLKAPVD